MPDEIPYPSDLDDRKPKQEDVTPVIITDPETPGFEPKALALTIGTILANIVGVLVVLKIIPQDSASEMNNAINAILASGVAVFGNITVIIGLFKHSQAKQNNELRRSVLRAYQFRQGNFGISPNPSNEIEFLRAILKD